MHISKLTLKDFKSFGGSHELTLSPGMTAIVGPNGSGKSNLLDALRWVLGDSRASKLRAAKQGGLIFHGSVSRAKAAEAEVSIRMRDDERLCTIRRRVSDAGATVAVDGARATLVELDEVKRAWRLAGDQFAFIGQGEVAEVIQQRPSARRMLLESLFGIDAYRRRRSEAADKLEEAREEYGRLRAFTAELSARREQIAPEVKRASYVRELEEANEDDRRVLYWARRARAERAAREMAPMIGAARAGAALAAAWRGRWERAAAFARGALEQLASTARGGARELDELRDALAAFTKSAYASGASLTSARRRAEECAEEAASTEARLAELRADRDRSSAELRGLNEQSSDIRKKLDAARARQDAARGEAEAARAAREERMRERGEIETEMTSLKSRIKSTREALNGLADGAARRPDDPMAGIRREMAELERRHEELLADQTRAAEDHRALFASLQTITAELQRARRDASRHTSRLAEMQEQASSELYPRPVQHLLSAARLGRLKIRSEMAAVIDAFSCGTDIAGAIEAFLGGRQFWLLVDTMEDAGECVDELKRKQAGRATFLPLERARPRTPDMMYRLPVSGVVGWAMELIEPSPRWRAALEHLMGDLLIVEEFAVGQALVRGGFRGPIATPDGDVFQPGGTVSGGKMKKPGRTIEIKQALASVEREAAAARARADALAADFTRVEEAEAAAATKKDGIAAELRALASRRSELDAAEGDIRRERDRARNEREAMAASLKESAARYGELARRRRALRDEEAAAPEAEDFDETSREIERLSAEAALVDERVRSAFALSERIANEARGLERTARELDDERAACAREIAENSATLERLARRYSETASRRREIARESAEFSERYERATAAAERRAARLDRAKTAAEAAAASLAEIEARAASDARELAELIANWDERYPYPGPDGEWDHADPDALRRAIRERERRVRELGDVDMGALSEDRSLQERLSFLGGQLEDVSEGMASLAKMISDADEQARVVFTRALEDIDARFGELFKRLFTGGDARLEMIEGESLWDSGVDVIARPPGKHPQSITQLSGGEQSLSAIALLFASLEVADCPIAVLDEVDAALDEVNLRRFADLTKDASRERQIFVMTHRRVTMERADVLYGVTLAEPGLSQVIGVRVEDWA